LARLVINDVARELLQKHRIMTNRNGQWSVGSELLIEPEAILEPYSHIMTGNVVPRSIGAFSYSFSRCDPYMNLGRYGSIALGMVLMGSSHPDDWVSSHPFSHNPGPIPGVKAYLQDIGIKRFPLQDFERHDPCVYIGHDVWIGDHAMIKRGVTIGHGAIIGARAVVTKDVPPYAIVGGVPARIIRYRFAEDLIERLLASQWWRYGPDVLQVEDIRDPARFVNRLADQEAKGEITPLDLPPLTGKALLEAGGAP
jgi:virginiamycin A acetyltransferase